MSAAVNSRSQAQVEYTWAADSIFPDVNSWEAAMGEADAAILGLTPYRGTLGLSAEHLLRWFDAYHKTHRYVADIGQYAMMFTVVDTADQEAAARSARASALWSRFAAATAFATPEILSIDPAQINIWMHSSEELSVYRRYFENLERERPHTRNEEVQELLGLVGDAFGGTSQVHSLLSDAEIKFDSAFDETGGSHEVIQPTIHRLLGASDRYLRKSAFESYADGYLKHKNSLATCLASGVKQDVFYARARRFDSAIDASLHDLRFPAEVFHTVIDTFRERVQVWRRYFKVLKRALGVDELHMYDLKAPLARTQPVVTYQQAIDWISAGMAPLGEEYVSAMRRGLLEDRWVDVYPNRGKNMGAFSSGHQGVRPFIFMSYNDNLFGMSTLAHELGHSMHSYLGWQNQPPVYSGCGSEAPSNFNQALTRAYLLKTVEDKNFQIAVIEEALANFYRYFLIMPTIARFELEIHSRIEAGNALTADGMNAVMAGLFREVFGNEVVCDEDRLGITWAQFPTHVYGNIFMFLYTVGIAAAHALAAPIIAGEEGAAERYLDYLKAGASVTDLEGLKMAGVDMTSAQPIHTAFDTLDGLVSRLEELL